MTTPYEAALRRLQQDGPSPAAAEAAGQYAIAAARDMGYRLPAPLRVQTKRVLGFLGQASPGLITISAAHVALSPLEEVADTLAHEVSHHAAGLDYGHDTFVWRETARAFGASPRPAAEDSAELRPAYRYVRYCVSCRHVTRFLIRRSSRIRVCLACESRVALVDLREDGEVLNAGVLSAKQVESLTRWPAPHAAVIDPLCAAHARASALLTARV